MVNVFWNRTNDTKEIFVVVSGDPVNTAEMAELENFLKFLRCIDKIVE